MTNTLAYHVGSNTPGYLPEGDVTCWDTTGEAREALLTLLYAHVGYLAEACDCDDYNPECDECDMWWCAQNATEGTRESTLSPGDGWQEGVQVALPSGRSLPIVFWMEPVSMDHAAECEPLPAE